MGRRRPLRVLVPSENTSTNKPVARPAPPTWSQFLLDAAPQAFFHGGTSYPNMEVYVNSLEPCEWSGFF